MVSLSRGSALQSRGVKKKQQLGKNVSTLLAHSKVLILVRRAHLAPYTAAWVQGERRLKNCQPTQPAGAAAIPLAMRRQCSNPSCFRGGCYPTSQREVQRAFLRLIHLSPLPFTERLRNPIFKVIPLESTYVVHVNVWAPSLPRWCDGSRQHPLLFLHPQSTWKVP